MRYSKSREGTDISVNLTKKVALTASYRRVLPCDGRTPHQSFRLFLSNVCRNWNKRIYFIGWFQFLSACSNGVILASWWA